MWGQLNMALRITSIMLYQCPMVCSVNSAQLQLN
jgi:hypothetical protein